MRSRPSRVTRLSSAIGMTTAALLSISTPAFAQDAEKLSPDELFAAKVSGDAYNVSVSNAPHIARSMRVTGPRGFAAESDSLVVSSSKPLADGLYNYEITGALPSSEVVFDATSNRENGRSEDARPSQQPTGVIASGHFRIVNGTVFEPGDVSEEQASSSALAQPADSHQHDLR